MRAQRAAHAPRVHGCRSLKAEPRKQVKESRTHVFTSFAHRARSRLFRRRTCGFVHRQRLGRRLFAGACLSIVVLDHGFVKMFRSVGRFTCNVWRFHGFNGR